MPTNGGLKQRLGWCSDSEIEQALVALGAPQGIGVVVQALHALYFDGSRDDHRSQWQCEDYTPTFHNWDHGRNVWNFANWYSVQEGAFSWAGRTPAHDDRVCALCLSLAALCHDVMHPGTPNRKDMVEATFLPQVRRWAEEQGLPCCASMELEGFAEDLWSQLQDAGVEEAQFAKALGTGFCSKEKEEADVSLGVPKLLATRAPQETLHAWITTSLLRKHVASLYNGHRAEIIVPITMTSINLHFMTMGNHSAYIDAMLEPNLTCFRLGLILRALDMGWCSQEGINAVNGHPCCEADAAEVGKTFGPRFLVESGGASSDYVAGEQKFADTVGAYVKELLEKSIVPEGVAGIFFAGIEAHRKLVSQAEFQEAVRRLQERKNNVVSL
eukprot:TRINITY_DN100493_c0_g1_i1.p1 TRINITY_DN100493_c0_g1~~TRINITY_DN100493_c0_g1_i1.p1  ORF type:complete len:385 (+),score=88.52 TRINITY_DN100493_c0_g1_i1:132-1286(+)